MAAFNYGGTGTFTYLFRKLKSMLEGYLKTGDLNSAVDDVLVQAKASGEFDGTSVTVSDVSESSEDGGTNTVTFSDGRTLHIKNGSEGSKGDKGDTGDTGPMGANATINGVNALTLSAGAGLSGSQSGNTYTLTLASHAASYVSSGTFAGQVVANASGQAAGTSLLRNSKLVSADTDPTVEGEINWTYK